MKATSSKIFLITILFLLAPFCNLNSNIRSDVVNTDAGQPKFYKSGNNSDKICNPVPGIILAGGGTDNDDAMRWMLNRADGGDVVIIRSSGGDGYNNYLYNHLGIKVNSVTSIVIDSREKADKDSVYRTICRAEALFIAGGDQGDYVRCWRGTKVDEAIAYLIEKKGVTIGGTSAGMAVLSEICYSSRFGSSTSPVTLADPFDKYATLEKSFISLTYLKNTITDTHFSQRNRKGRLIAFLARTALEYSTFPKGVAADEKSAICIDPNGIGTVYGGKVSFFKCNNSYPQVCVPGVPLTWISEEGAVLTCELYGGNGEKSKFDFNSWEPSVKTEWRGINVNNGELVNK